MLFKVVFILMAVAAFLFGIPLLYRGLISLKNAHESVSWPTTSGEVTVSEMIFSEDNTRTANSRHTTISYQAAIVYQYRVNGITFSSDKTAFGEVYGSDPNLAQQVLNKYPKGKRVIVYYSPTNPATATLEPGLSWKTFLVPVIGLFFTVMGFVTSFSFRKFSNQLKSGKIVMLSKSRHLTLF